VELLLRLAFLSDSRVRVKSRPWAVFSLRLDSFDSFDSFDSLRDALRPCEGVVFVEVDPGSLATVVVSPFMKPWALRLENAVDSGMPVGRENGDRPPKPR